MSGDEYGTPESTWQDDAYEPEQAASIMAARMRKVRELAEASVSGARSTAEATATMAAVEADETAAAAQEASEAAADAIGASVSSALQGIARVSGAVVGGAKGTTGGLILAAQIGVSAAGEALRSAAGSWSRATGQFAEGVVIGFEDQAQGTEAMRDAANTLAQELFDATAGGALGALGSLATAVGAFAGGAKGAASSSLGGVKQIANAGADATYVVGKSAAGGGTEVLRRALRRDEEI